MEIKMTKSQILRLANTILEVSGCRELCRQCVVDHPKGVEYGRCSGVRLSLDGKDYGFTQGGCCKRCQFLTEKGCRPGREGRPLTCVSALCNATVARLKDMGLHEWWSEFRWFDQCDFRSPNKHKRKKIFKIPFNRRTGGQ